MEVHEDSLIDVICQTTISEYFDEVIGHIEDIVLSESFQFLHDNFLETHWQEIENTEENKLEYMDVFNEYTTTFESFLVEELTRRMENFDMQRFAEELNTTNAFHDPANYGEIFELLHSFTNFQIFKELMLDYRSQKEGNTQHLEFDILITRPICPEQTHVYNEMAKDDCSNENANFQKIL